MYWLWKWFQFDMTINCHFTNKRCPEGKPRRPTKQWFFYEGLSATCQQLHLKYGNIRKQYISVWHNYTQLLRPYQLYRCLWSRKHKHYFPLCLQEFSVHPDHPGGDLLEPARYRERLPLQKTSRHQQLLPCQSRLCWSLRGLLRDDLQRFARDLWKVNIFICKLPYIHFNIKFCRTEKIS